MRIKLALLILLSMSLGTRASAYDLKDLLSGLAASKDSVNTDGGRSSLGGMLGSILSSGKIDVEAMSGSWEYTSPAVSFKSDNLLKKAGGGAAAAVVENKLSAYYKMAGITDMKMSIESDSTFTMEMRKVTLKGTINRVTDGDSQANFVFNFMIGGKMKIGSLDTYVSMAGNRLDITFDVTKLVGLVTKIASVSGGTTIKGVATLLESYDGVCAGFKFRRQ